MLFVEISRFHELAPASEPEAVMKLLNDVFWDVSKTARLWRPQSIKLLFHPFC